jgi:penicillin-binding protein 2
MLGQGETIKDFQHRFPIFFGALLVMIALLSARLLYLQIYRGTMYRDFSEQNSLRQERIPGPRGQIFDRYNRLLVDNRLQLDITITPQFVKNPKAVIAQLARLLDENPERLFERYKNKVAGVFKFQPVAIVENAPWEAVVKIESSKAGLSGVEIETRIRRHYLHEQVGAQVFGYLSEITKKELETSAQLKGAGGYQLSDWLGRAGLERKFELELRGIDGIRYVEVDAHGHRVARSGDVNPFLHNLPKDVPPRSGRNLVLTLDQDLQVTAAAAMKGKLGATVALDPRTGEVLAMISNPSFNPAEMTDNAAELWQSIVNNPYSPLRNKSIQDHFPSGSTFKIFSALAALDAGVINENTSVYCPGFFKFGRRTYNCHIKAGHGPVSLREAIRGSCDVFFYSIASRIGIDVISKMATRFGLGRKTGIDLLNEASGLMPTESWKKAELKQEWTPGETLSAAIGQGYNLVTPLQLAVAYATFVNGGNLYKPYLVSQVVDPEGTVVERFAPKLISNYKVSPEYLAAIKESMFDVANHPRGTAYNFVHTPDSLISGKSGTAQVVSMSREDLFKPCINLPFERRHHAWFVGYAPKENPEIVVSVIGMHECGGSRSASPVVKAVIQEWQRSKRAREQLQGPSPAQALNDYEILEMPLENNQWPQTDS